MDYDTTVFGPSIVMGPLECFNSDGKRGDKGWVVVLETDSCR